VLTFIVRRMGMLESKLVNEEKKEIVRNLYESGIAEEFIAMQLDLEIPTVISILKEIGIYKGTG
jgi:predicted transcriptional regulator YheO